MENILVTGGSGFVGSYVIENLLKKRLRVINFQHKANSSWKDINVFKGDVLDNDSVIEAVGYSDGVIHLAGILGTAETIENPIQSIDVNIIGSLNVFEACRMHKKRAAYISVGHYWMNNSYAITKHAAERFSLMYNKEHNTKIALVRAYNIYGPGQRMKPIKKIIPNLVIPALLNKPITVYGSGNQVVDMIFVEDIAEIIVRALIQDHGIYNSVFEAGYGKGITVNQIVETIVKKTGSSSPIIHVKMRAGEQPDSRVLADADTLKPLGIYQDSLTTLEKGLDRTIAWYRDNLHGMVEDCEK
jgi:nucleoside-diphosphate-sugar epimerase